MDYVYALINLVRTYQLNILLALSSVCLAILIFVLMTNFLSKEKKKALIFFILATILLLVSDRFAYIFRGNETHIGGILARVFKYLVFFNILNVSYGFNGFLKCLYKENHPNKKVPGMYKVIEIIIIIGHVMLLISQFNHMYYSFDEFNNYHREKLYIICYLFPIVSTVLQYITVLKDIKNTSKRILIPLIIYFILPILAAILQLFFSGISIANIMIGGSVIVLYLVNIYDANSMLEETKKTEADLKLGNEIQMNECPNVFPAFPDRKEFDLFASLNPAKQVGGDFYDYFLIDDNHLAIVIADVTGKGVPAALNMIKAKTLIKGTSTHSTDPAELLGLVNDSFLDNNQSDVFVTCWLGIVEISTGKLIFTNAGHEDALIYTKKDGFTELQTKHGVPIGAMEDAKYHNNEVKLSKGDRLFLFTDGVLDAINNKGKRYGFDRLLKNINYMKDLSIYELINSLRTNIEGFSYGCEQFDDITMLCFELNDDKKVNSNQIVLKKRFYADLDSIPEVYNYFTKPISDLVGVGKVKKYYVVVDEIFSNIVNHGFDNSNENYITIEMIVDVDNRNIKATFIDNGIPFNPLEKEDPNTSLSAEERKEGGLGIYIVKKMMDNVSYEYKNNMNYLTVEKKY